MKFDARDKTYVKEKVRVAGPFTVESLSPNRGQAINHLGDELMKVFRV